VLVGRRRYSERSVAMSGAGCLNCRPRWCKTELGTYSNDPSVVPVIRANYWHGVPRLTFLPFRSDDPNVPIPCRFTGTDPVAGAVRAAVGCPAAVSRHAPEVRPLNANPPVTHSLPAATMPRGIPFIVANEFAERFCFYGINSILAIYLVQSLHYGDAAAATWVSLFKSWAYPFPLAGAVLSDVFLGKFRTVLSFSVVYCAGCVLLGVWAVEIDRHSAREF
jgi:hypothetical protein